MGYLMKDLAIHDGPKAKGTPTLPMFPGGLEIGEEQYAGRLGRFVHLEIPPRLTEGLLGAAVRTQRRRCRP